MQDRFKFRAWNKLSNEMKDVISLNINYEFPECTNVILETNTFDDIKTHNKPITCANGLNNVVLMQCTGLKDKNGKLIYEGDIVETWKFSTGETSNRVVAWNEARCGCRLYTIDHFKRGIIDSPQSMVNVTTIEIIGNIYENKDLLESEQE